jgi:hypothetical protein
LHLTSPANSRELRYQAAGVVRVVGPDPTLEGGSVRIRSLATGLAEEAFLDGRGTFAQEVELQPETDNALEWAVRDIDDREVARVVTVVRHQGESGLLGPAVLPTQLGPPWPRFAQLVRHCLDLAAQVADRTGRDREELFEHVRAQERYAEQAHEGCNQALYRECLDNLEKYAGYLSQLLADALPRPLPRPPRPPEEEARDEVKRFRAFLSAVWKKARERRASDLEARLAEIAKQAHGLSQRLKAEPVAVIRDARRLGTEVEKVAAQLDGARRQTPGEDARAAE